MAARSPTPDASPIDAIAQRVGVTPSTVARVLNGETLGAYPKIARRNEKIRRLADELNYRPSFNARSLRGGKTRQVALLYPEHDPMLGAAYGPMVQKLVGKLQEGGHHLTLWGLPEGDRDRSDLLLDRRFDGCLVHHAMTSAIREAVERSGLPAVLLNTEVPGMRSVVADDAGGAERATRHLIEHGHRDVALMTIENSPHYEQQRRLGYERAMSAAGLTPRPIRVPYHDRPAVEVFLGMQPCPSALLCTHAHQALPLCQGLRERGWDLPADLSVVAFDNVQATEFSVPPLTVVEVPHAAMGQAAGVQLLALLNGSEPEPLTPMPERLIERASVATRT